MENEIWKDIPNYEGYYQASTLGKIKSLDRLIVYSNGGQRIHKGRILKAGKRGDYLALRLHKNSQKHVNVHRIIAETFIKNNENKPQVNHKNGNKYDNRVENLEWCNASENKMHSYKIGTSKPLLGEKQNGSKLTKKEVLKIRKLHGTLSNKKIAMLFNIRPSYVSDIKNKKTWKHI